MAMRDFEISKFLTEYDITDKIALPNRIIDHMIPMMNGSHFLDLKVKDAMGQEWELRYYTPPNGKKKSPVFTTGWHKFVKDTRLQVGDKFTVYGDQVRAVDGQLKMEYTIKVEPFNGAATDAKWFAFEPVNANAIMPFQVKPTIEVKRPSSKKE